MKCLLALFCLPLAISHAYGADAIVGTDLAIADAIAKAVEDSQSQIAICADFVTTGDRADWHRWWSEEQIWRAQYTKSPEEFKGVQALETGWRFGRDQDSKLVFHTTPRQLNAGTGMAYANSIDDLNKILRARDEVRRKGRVETARLLAAGNDKGAARQRCMLVYQELLWCASDIAALDDPINTSHDSEIDAIAYEEARENMATAAIDFYALMAELRVYKHDRDARALITRSLELCDPLLRAHGLLEEPDR